MIWLIWFTLSAVLALCSQGEYRTGLISICVGLVLVWAGKLLLSEVAFWVFSALIWIGIAAFISTTGSRYTVASGLLLVAAGVLVLPARLFGGDYEFGNPWLFASDVFGVCAILVLGWPFFADLARGGVGLDAGDRAGGDRGSVPHHQTTQETQE